MIAGHQEPRSRCRGVALAASGGKFPKDLPEGVPVTRTSVRQSAVEVRLEVADVRRGRRDASEVPPGYVQKGRREPGRVPWLECLHRVP